MGAWGGGMGRRRRGFPSGVECLCRKLRFGRGRSGMVAVRIHRGIVDIRRPQGCRRLQAAD